ncbi:hypothetical protein L207DRAFT_517518 [Hyaloscypha variabilis F]|uniref:Uncharacterized protein n=1 Tax=Hyaloscypha variabilis (strain UAMH 11265 / GT02V1 / F) TaxID=1149755 RepID=A0A2J6R765_HYAVF|nr:hypothetical protein L207DRAFT_517518 [Hyaloscypha variabilis F]
MLAQQRNMSLLNVEVLLCLCTPHVSHSALLDPSLVVLLNACGLFKAIMKCIISAVHLYPLSLAAAATFRLA